MGLADLILIGQTLPMTLTFNIQESEIQGYFNSKQVQTKRLCLEPFLKRACTVGSTGPTPIFTKAGSNHG